MKIVVGPHPSVLAVGYIFLSRTGECSHQGGNGVSNSITVEHLVQA
jgi:hypothetical protein